MKFFFVISAFSLRHYEIIFAAASCPILTGTTYFEDFYFAIFFKVVATTDMRFCFPSNIFWAFQSTYVSRLYFCSSIILELTRAKISKEVYWQSGGSSKVTKYHKKVAGREFRETNFSQDTLGSFYIRSVVFIALSPDCILHTHIIYIETHVVHPLSLLSSITFGKVMSKDS